MTTTTQKNGWTRGTWVGFLATIMAAMVTGGAIHDRFIEPAVLDHAEEIFVRKDIYERDVRNMNTLLGIIRSDILEIKEAVK